MEKYISLLGRIDQGIQNQLGMHEIVSSFQLHMFQSKLTTSTIPQSYLEYRLKSYNQK